MRSLGRNGAIVETYGFNDLSGNISGSWIDATRKATNPQKYLAAKKCHNFEKVGTRLEILSQSGSKLIRKAWHPGS